MGLDEFIKEEDEFGFEPESVRGANQVGEKKIRRVRANDLRPEMDQMWKEGKPLGLECGISVLNPIFRWRRKGGLYCISGHEQAGKSEFTKYILGLRAKLYKTKIAIYSPEEDTDIIVEDLCRTHALGNVNHKFKNKVSWDAYNRSMDFVNEHFEFLEFDGMVDFKTLIETYSELAEEGFRDFLTDPWNYVAEGSMDQSGQRYLNTSLTHMKTFSKRYEANNLIVEHQNNRIDSKGNLVPASKDNITGGAIWKKKCDTIIIVHNNWTEETQDSSVNIQTAKNKQQRYNGQKGTRTLWFDVATGQYLEDSPNNRKSQFAISFEDQKPLHPKNETEDDDQPF